MAGYRNNNQRGGNRGGNQQQQRRTEAPPAQVTGEIITPTTAMIPDNGADRSVAIAVHGMTRTREIEAAVLIAQRHPRSEDAARVAMIKTCQNPLFAEKACYRYPRGKTEDGKPNTVKGPSVVLAREMARVWKHMRHGFAVTADDDDSRTILAYSWDLEANGYEEKQAQFRKVIYRKGQGNITPDERELLELTNRVGAKAERNCIIHLMPWLLVQELVEIADATMADSAAKDPDALRKKVADGFARLNVPIEQVEEFIGAKLAHCSPADLETLRQIWATIKAGESSWSEFYKKTQDEPQAGGVDPATAAVFAGATAETAERPGSKPAADRRAFLPTELRQPEHDQRPEAEYLLDVVATGTQKTVDAVLAYIGNADHIPKPERTAVMRAAMSRGKDFTGGDSSEGDEIPFDPDKEQKPAGTTTEQKPPPEPALPHEVTRAITEIKQRTGMAAQMQYNIRWKRVVGAKPELDQYTPMVDEVLAKALEPQQ